MSRWSKPLPNRARTQADRDRDLILFCGQARVEAVRAITDEQLAARYGVDRKLATYHRTMRLQREGRQVC